MLINLKKSVTFFVNGNNKIGFGHISRCLILAREFKNNQIPVLFVTPLDCSYKEKIALEFESHTIECFNTNELSQYNLQFRDLAIIDVLESEFSNFQIFKSLKIFRKVASITLFDFGNLTRFEDISFFPAFKGSSLQNIKTPYGKLIQYVGKEYLIFNNFNILKNSKNFIIENKKDFLITMGGADPQNLTMRILKSLEGTEKTITVILSSKAINYKSVKNYCTSQSNIEIVDFVENLPSLFSNYKLLIINGGLTRYEAVLYRVPFVAVSMHELQYSITEDVCKLGVGLNLGVASKLTDNDIKTEIINLLNDNDQLQNMYHSSNGLLDGLGAKRIFNLLKDMTGT